MTLEPILLFEITMDLCPSINNSYPTARNGKRILSESARSWKRDWMNIVSSKKCSHPYHFPINFPIRIERHFIFKNKHRRDYNNYIKILDDALVDADVLRDDSISILASDSNTHEINPDIDSHIVRIKVFSF